MKNFFVDIMDGIDPTIDAVLGDTVTYTPSGGSPASVVGVFTKDYSERFESTGYQPLFEMDKDAVSSPAADDTLVYKTVTYVVRSVLHKKPDSNRITLVLGKQ